MMAEYLNLNIAGELLDSLAEGYQRKAHQAVNVLFEKLAARVLRPETAEEIDRQLQCQDWLYVITSTLWELRTSLVYAEAHHDQHIKRSTHSAMIPTDSSLAYDYFIENAALRAHSVVEKTLQLLNVVCRLGLSEKGQVKRDNVKKALGDPEYMAAVDRLFDILELMGEMRNAHVHRFDPGTARSEVVEVAVAGTDPVQIVNLYQLRERPLSAAEQLSKCRQTYRGLDDELAALFHVMSRRIRKE